MYAAENPAHPLPTFNTPATIRFNGRDFTVERKVSEKHTGLDAIYYEFTGKRGASYFTMRNAHRPHQLYVMIGRGFNVKTVWLSDEGGGLRVIQDA